MTRKIVCLVLAFVGAGALGCGTSGNDTGSGVCGESVDRTGYLEGPFGMQVGDTLANLSFVDSEGNPYALDTVFQDSDARLLLLSTGAGWCTACIEEQPQLQEWATNYASLGLRVIMTVFEDANTAAATVGYAATWKLQNNLTLPVLVDSEAKLSAYYDASQAPMNMIVEACTMKIVKIIVGADRSAIETIIEAKL